MSAWLKRYYSPVDVGSISILSCILLVLLSASVFSWDMVNQSKREQASKRFTLESSYLSHQIQARFNAYEQVLRGGVALFKGSEYVSRDEWRSYISELALADYFPGIQGVGYSKWIRDTTALAQLEQRVQSEGFTDFVVKPVPTGERETTAIVYLEPFDERNRRAFGYDMYSEINRRTAMQRARDTGNAALSGKVELVQEITSDKQAGFLLYLPVYAKEAPPTSIKARQDQLIGFVYSPFRADDLMEGILSRDISNVVFQVFDVTPSGSDTLLYDGHADVGLDTFTHSPQFTTSQQLDIAGRQWTIAFSSTPTFENTHDSATAVAVLFIGILVSLLISSIAWMLSSARQRIARRTIELRNLEHVNNQLSEATRVAQSASLAKSSFLAAMSHEIRTPMNGVVGMVEVLLNDSPEPRQAASLKIVLDSATSLLRIIDDVLDFSKIEAGHLQLENTDESLSDIVEGVVASIVPQALSRHVTLSSFIDPVLPSTVSVDAVRLRQILTNLIGNAVKFSGSMANRHGRVQIQVRRDAADSTQIQFDIIDNGVGIEKTAADRIFEHFVQAEASTTRRFGGSGLGLAICKRLVSIMQGSISVKSEPGSGSVFSVVLPLVPSMTNHAQQLEDLSGIKCLLVESDQFSAQAMKTYLEASGAKVSLYNQCTPINNLDCFEATPIAVIGLRSDILDVCASLSWLPSRLFGRVLLTRGGIDPTSTNKLSKAAAENQIRDTEVPNNVSIQLDGLRRRDLNAAIAVACGRLSADQLHDRFAPEPIATVVSALSPAVVRREGYTILVAEDDPINQKVLQKQLTLLGFSADFAADGCEALSLWRRNTYFVLITDLHMPVVDGYQLTATIRAEESDDNRLPIIALTANALQEDSKRAVQLGVDRHLTKPIRLSALKSALEPILIEAAVGQTGEITPDAKCDTAPSINQPVYEPQVLEELVEGDNALTTQLLEQFIRQLDEYGHPLTTAVSQKDKQVTAPLAHRLISTSQSVGAQRLGHVCSLLEIACNDSEHSLSRQDAMHLDETLSLTRSAIAAALVCR